MASPIGHSLVGLAVADLSESGSAARRYWWYALTLLSVNAADLDFLPGLVVGDVNRFHRSATHSLLAAVIFGLGVMVVARLWRLPAVRAALVSTGLYATHLFLDFLSGNGAKPSGQPLLWPFARGEVISPWTPLAGIDHGTRGDALWQFIEVLLSLNNLQVILVEALLFAPLLLLARYLRAPASAGRGRVRPATGSARESEGAVET